MRPLFVGVLVSLAVAIAAAQPKYGVTVTPTKGVDFAKFKTYEWTNGQPARSKDIDGQIVAAIDKELKGLGFTKKEGGGSDVLVRYGSLQRTDVDLKSKPDDKTGMRPQMDVGTLVVDLLAPADKHQLLRMRLDKPIDTERSKLEAAINAGVAEMFSKYPTRTKK